MKKIKLLVTSLLICCVLLSSTGCIVRINEEKNNNIVVAVIDGEHEILKKDYLPVFQYYKTMYEYYGMAVTNDVRDMCLESVITSKIYKIEMDAIEWNINEEDLEKAREDYQEELEELAKSYEEEAKAEADKDEGDEPSEERDFMQEAKDYYAEMFEESDMTEEEYLNEIAETYRLERYKKHLMSDIVASDEDILKKYNELKDAQTLTPDPDAEILIYEPSGVKYKFIQISLTEDEYAEYEKKLEEDKDKAEEYAKETTKARAEAIVERLESGESFEDIIDEVNEILKNDCGVDEEDIVESSEELKLYKTGSTTGFKGQLDAKLLSLANGAITDALYSAEGTYVIAKCYGRFESSTAEYEVGNDIYKEIKESLEEELRNKKWDDELSDEIIKKHKIKKYTSRYYNKNY